VAKELPCDRSLVGIDRGVAATGFAVVKATWAEIGTGSAEDLHTMFRHHRIRIWTCLFALTVASVASAETIVHVDTVPIAPTNWNNVMEIPKFDPSLGTLTGIEFELLGMIRGDIRFESLDALPATIHVWLQAQIKLSRPDMSELVVALPVEEDEEEVSAYDGVLDFGGTSGRTYLDVPAEATVSMISPPPESDLALFTGEGVIALPIRAEGRSRATGAGNLVARFATRASAELTVTYTYTPVPPGACCFEDGHCEYVLEAECTTGDWTMFELCDPNPCEQPSGACCDLETGECVVMTAQECAAQGGEYLGDGIECDPNPCPNPNPTEDTSWGQIKAKYR